MSNVDFYAQSRAVQSRLIDSFAGRFPPTPLVWARGRPGGTAVWLFVVACAAAGLGAIYFVGFGKLGNALAVHPPPLIGVYAMLGFLFLLGIFVLYAKRSRATSLPWVAGVYVFPVNVIDARQYRLKVYPLAELASVKPSGSGIALGFRGGHRFVFPLPDVSTVRQAAIAIEAARDRAKQPRDPQAMFELDPLQAPSVTSPLGPQSPMKRNAPLWERVPWIPALVLGALLGAVLWQVRNVLSDERMSARARAQNEPAAFRAYLERGVRQRDEVKNVLLPRAELAEAQKLGTVEAIDAFIAKNSGSSIVGEITAARQTALVRAFEQAREQKSLKALHEFATRYPDHHLAADVAAARHAVFVSARQSYKKLAAPDAPESIHLVEQLLAYAERVGPRSTPEGLRGAPVQFRFQRVPSETMGRADIALAKNLSFNGVVSYPTRYFDAAHTEPREKALIAALIARFSSAFAAEVLTFEQGPLITTPEGELPQIKLPTLAVSQRVEWTGGAFESKRPRGIFVGLIFLYRTTFALPGEASPPRFKHNVMEQVPTELLSKNVDTPPGQLELKAYEWMAADARSQFLEKYLARFFAPSAEPKK